MKAEEKFMELAIEEATRAAREFGDYAIGAVVVKDGAVVARGGNRANRDKDQTAHAEIVALRKASEEIGSKYLKGCILYSTNEPCAMCSTACVWAEMEGIVYGANNGDLKKHWTSKGEGEKEYKAVYITCEEVLGRSNPKLSLIKEFMRDKCLELFKLY